jgi:putative addiction module component (TIGR02574 family)
MTDLVAELAARASALSPEDRARLAEELLSSLDPRDAEVEMAWDVELRRRIEEVERGAAPLIAAEEAFIEVRRAIAR